MRKDFDRTYVTKHDNVAIITLNHPEVLNAASLELAKGLDDALYYVEELSNGFRAAILTGEGKGFCSGANLSVAGMSDEQSPIRSGLKTHFHPLLRHMREFKMPLVCAVNGAAAGIGMSIALSGDLILASRSAYFLQAFARIGLVPDGGSTWLLPRLVGLARAKELSLLAEKLPAEKALDWGLINRVCDDASLMQESMAMAKRLANGPTVALSMIRDLYVDSMRNSYEDQLELEQHMQIKAFHTEDFAEGVSAFLEKRPAVFKGK